MKVTRMNRPRTYAIFNDSGKLVGEIYSRPKGRSFGLFMNGWYMRKFGWNQHSGASGRSFATLRLAKAEAEMLLQWQEL